MMAVIDRVDKLHMNNTYCIVLDMVSYIHSDTFLLETLEAGCVEHSQFYPRARQ